MSRFTTFLAYLVAPFKQYENSRCRPLLRVRSKIKLTRSVLQKYLDFMVWSGQTIN